MRTDGYNGKADLYRPKSSVNMMSSTDSDLPLACGSACSRDPELVFQMPVFNPKTSQGWRRLANSFFSATWPHYQHQAKETIEISWCDPLARAQWCAVCR